MELELRGKMSLLKCIIYMLVDDPNVHVVYPRSFEPVDIKLSYSYIYNW